MTKDEEKADVLNVFFASVLNNKTGCLPCTSPLSWKTVMGRRMKLHNPKGNS